MTRPAPAALPGMEDAARYRPRRRSKAKAAAYLPSAERVTEDREILLRAWLRHRAACGTCAPMPERPDPAWWKEHMAEPCPDGAMLLYQAVKITRGLLAGVYASRPAAPGAAEVAGQLDAQEVLPL